MSVSSIALRGVPPLGLGIYGREAIERGPWDFVVINGFRSDRASQAATVRAMGAKVWLFGTPGEFTPSTWRAGLATLLARTLELGAEGLIVDGENGWPQVSSEVRTREATALGEAMRAAAEKTRVGFTSYPTWPAAPALARACAGACFGSVQIYGRGANDAESFSRWYERWRELWGSHLGMSIAGWAANDTMRDSAGFRSYLAKLPASSSAIVWDTTGTMPTYIAEALAEYRPARGAAGALELGGLAVRSPLLLVTVALVVLVVGALLWSFR